MPHDRNADVDEAAHDIEYRSAAFELHRRGAALQEPAGIPHRFFDADLVGEERHVGDDERPLGAACHGAGVVIIASSVTVSVC
jgi:hypothetical protein